MAAFLGTRVEVGLRRRRGPARTLPLWIPAPYRSTGQALRRDDACGGGQDCRETGTPPRRAPALDTGFRRYDGGGVGVGECCWCRRGTGPAVAGRAFRERPLRRGWRVGSAGRLAVGGGAAPRGVRCPLREPQDRLRFPSVRTASLAPPRACGFLPSRNDACGRPFDRLRADGVPGPAPLDTGFRRYDDGGVGPSTGSGRTGFPAPHGPSRHRPSGFLPPQE